MRAELTRLRRENSTLRPEREILEERPSSGEGVDEVTRFACNGSERARTTTSRALPPAEVSRSGVYGWLTRPRSPRALADAVLTEDCRHLSRRLKADLLAAGERIVRVPPKLMAHARGAARSYGKSDPIGALAVARAALREPDLPTAQFDGPSREVHLLIDHRESLVTSGPASSTGCAGTCTNSTRPSSHRPGFSGAPSPPDAVLQHLADLTDLVARLARSLVERCRQLTSDIPALDKELEGLVQRLSPALLEICGCSTLTAGKLVGKTADVRRFRSRHAYARHNGTAPLPVWSGNRTRHRLSRSGNRQLNAALHRIAVTQAHYHPDVEHPDAEALLERRCANRDSRSDSLRALERRLSDVVYRALLADVDAALT